MNTFLLTTSIYYGPAYAPCVGYQRPYYASAYGYGYYCGRGYGGGYMVGVW